MGSQVQTANPAPMDNLAPMNSQALMVRKVQKA
jgi:hypothetical protein